MTINAFKSGFLILALATVGQWAFADESALESLKAMGGRTPTASFPTARPLTPSGFLFAALDQIDVVMPKLTGPRKEMMLETKLDIVVAIGQIQALNTLKMPDCTVESSFFSFGDPCIYLDDQKLGQACWENAGKSYDEAKLMAAESKCVLARQRRSRIILNHLYKANDLLSKIRNPRLTHPIALNVSRAMSFFQN